MSKLRYVRGILFCFLYLFIFVVLASNFLGNFIVLKCLSM